jgi:hypothetical protein
VFAVFIALVAGAIFERINGARFKAVTLCVLVAAVAAAYLSAYREKPITLREAQVNSRDRVPIELALGSYLAALPHPATLLMYESDHVGALQQAGIPLRQVISEWTHPEWEEALKHPPGDADYIVACEGDPVSVALGKGRAELPELLSFGTPEQPPCAIYEAPARATAGDLEVNMGSDHENKR